jgi:WD40-like Beta Propeller Repeat
MRRRDLLIIAPVVLLGGLAVADALRSEGSSAPATREAEPTTTRSVVTPPTAPEDLGRARFPRVAGAPGSIVFAEPPSCALREFDVSEGFEFTNVVSQTNCELWAATVTYKVAHGIRAPRGEDAVPFQFRDLARPQRVLGHSEALFGFLVWSPDGQRAAWCNGRRVGIDLELGAGRRLLPGCPAAYTADGQVALAEGNRLVVGGFTELETSGGIVFARYGTDGSVAVLVDEGRLERWKDSRRRQVLELPAGLRGRNPILSPDNCSALYRIDERIRLVDVGCSSFRPEVFPGTTAAWSPDGNWIAVGEPSQITFYDLLRRRGPVTWQVGAAQIAWRRL